MELNNEIVFISIKEDMNESFTCALDNAVIDKEAVRVISVKRLIGLHKQEGYMGLSKN